MIGELRLKWKDVVYGQIDVWDFVYWQRMAGVRWLLLWERNRIREIGICGIEWFYSLWVPMDWTMHWFCIWMRRWMVCGSSCFLRYILISGGWIVLNDTVQKWWNNRHRWWYIDMTYVCSSRRSDVVNCSWSQSKESWLNVSISLWRVAYLVKILWHLAKLES